jgi:polyisoprenoid-binding protein YceI
LLTFALGLAGCGDNPAADVPKAGVGAPAKLPPYPTDAKPAPAPDAKPADAPKSASAETPKPSAAPSSIPAYPLAIEPTSSKVEFIGAKKIGGAHNGGFKAFRGSAALADDKSGPKAVAVEIDTTSIFSDDPKLTGHLKTKDFFEVDTYPTATFITTEVKPGGEKGATHTLVGNLELHGVSKSITIPVVAKVEGETLALTSEFALNKDDFGMTFSGNGVIRPDVVIKLDVKAAPKK